MTALVIAEHDNVSVKGATLNTVTAAAACGDVHVLVAGHDAAEAAKAAAQIAGVAKVIHADGEQLAHGLAENLAGQVLAPPNSKVEEIVIRLEGTKRLTTPDEDGRFVFYNLPAGDYVVVVDEATLAEERRLASPGSVAVSLRRGGEPIEVIFGVEAVAIVKPVRQINLRASSSLFVAAPAPAPAPPSRPR